MHRHGVVGVVLDVLRHALLADEDLLAHREARLAVGEVLGDAHRVRARGAHP
jgi:hypothetical protein